MNIIADRQKNCSQRQRNNEKYPLRNFRESLGGGSHILNTDKILVQNIDNIKAKKSFSKAAFQNTSHFCDSQT